MPLRPLTTYQAQPYRPRTPVIVALIVVAALYVGSMFLNWVGVVAVDGSYLIVTGLRQANWILAVLRHLPDSSVSSLWRSTFRSHSVSTSSTSTTWVAPRRTR